MSKKKPDEQEPRERDEAIAELQGSLDEVLAKLHEAESRLADQESRIKVLGRGREETLLELNDARAQLERVTAERDRLQGQFNAVEAMQTETIALPEGSENGFRMSDPLPSIDDLMANLSLTDDGRDNAIVNAQRAEAPAAAEEDSADMIAPELIAPEEFGGSGDAPSSEGRGAEALLVFLNGDQPIKYPLYKKEITIGRADTADIRIDGDFISRLHARIVTSDGGVAIEDFGSKNGVHVNRERVSTRVLEHGDVISIGKLLFAFVDIA